MVVVAVDRTVLDEAEEEEETNHQIVRRMKMIIMIGVEETATDNNLHLTATGDARSAGSRINQ